MYLVIQLHLHQYPTSTIQIQLIGTLLSGTTLVWFTPLLKHHSPLLNHDFEMFFENFNATFGDLDQKGTFNIKIQFLCQRSCSIVVYTSKFNNWLMIFHGMKQH
jgi:hypothetical protein